MAEHGFYRQAQLRERAVILQYLEYWIVAEAGSAGGLKANSASAMS